MRPIRCGWTYDSTLAEGGVPPQADRDIFADLLSLRQKAGHPLRALVDAARTPEVLTALAAGPGAYESLYRGTSREKYLACSPILAECTEGSALLRRLEADAWGASWGVLVASSTSFEALAAHFRGLVVVRKELAPEKSGTTASATPTSYQRLLFRFYDPRVLRAYLPTCTDRELTRVFGPVVSFFVEDEQGGAILEYRREDADKRLAVGRRSAAVQRGSVLDADGGPGDAPLVIRLEQVPALREAVLREFELRTIRQLRDRQPGRTAAMTDGDLRSYVRHGRERAEGYGVRLARDVVRFVDCMLALGIDFERSPERAWALEILTDPRIAGTTKLDRVMARLRECGSEATEELCGAKADTQIDRGQ
jgi:hypothetical protein